MTLHRLLPAALFVLAPVGFATAQTAPSALPSDREVVAYVTTNWVHYDTRFAFLSGRPDQSPALVSVTKVECAADGETASCTFVVRGRFADGAVLRRAMDGHFGRRADGSIEMLIEVAAP